MILSHNVLYQRDTMSLFRKPDAFRLLIDLFTEHIRKSGAEVIVGLESRGFILGSPIAYNLALPFVPVRKKGKLPGKVVAYEYELEYGKDVFEMQVNAIRPGQKVVIVDDLIATGGSCSAAIELINKLGGQVIDCVVLVELPLDWQKKVHTKLTSFIKA